MIRESERSDLSFGEFLLQRQVKDSQFCVFLCRPFGACICSDRQTRGLTPTATCCRPFGPESPVDSNPSTPSSIMLGYRMSGWRKVFCAFDPSGSGTRAHHISEHGQMNRLGEKSLCRIFGPRGNPTLDNLSAIIRCDAGAGCII